MRVRNRADARERLENSPVVFLQPKDNKGKWKEIFGNDNPIHLEIGSGKGKFIHTLAESVPTPSSAQKKVTCCPPDGLPTPETVAANLHIRHGPGRALQPGSPGLQPIHSHSGASSAHHDQGHAQTAPSCPPSVREFGRTPPPGQRTM